MTKFTRLRQWSLCGCLIGLTCIPLQARAEASPQIAQQQQWNPTCAEVAASSQPAPSFHYAQLASFTSPACSVALSGPLIAPEPVAGSDTSLSSVVSTAESAAPAVNAALAVTPLENMVHQVNLLRVSKGLTPLKASAALGVSAQDFATRMGDNDFFSHNDPENDCNRPWDRMTAAGYANWNFAAENIAAGYDTVTKAMDGFINSSSHYNTLVNPKLREIGVGMFADRGDGNNVRLITSCPNFETKSGPYVFYWVQDFGSRNANGTPVLPVIIENEAPNTTSREVTVFVHGGEKGQPQWVSQMRFSTDGTTWSAYEPYMAQKTITLMRGSGLRNVHAQLKNAAGSMQTVSDTIYLVDPSFIMPFHVFMPALMD